MPKALTDIGGVATNLAGGNWGQALGSAENLWPDTGAQGLWNYLSAPAATSPTDANGQPTQPGGNLLRNLAVPLGLGFGAYNAYQQQQVQNRLMNQKWQPLNAQQLAQAQQQVEGQIGGSLGSGGPIQLATGVTNADFAIENALQQNNLNALRTAAGMFPQPTGLGDLFASLYGTPQTGPYATATSNSLAGVSPDLQALVNQWANYDLTGGGNASGLNWMAGDSGTGPVSGIA